MCPGVSITSVENPLPPLSGYKTPQPVVWAGVFPESQNDFLSLRSALERLKLSDSSLSFSEETLSMSGRGFRCGFLGMLHLEIIIERLKREFGLGLVVTAPNITYEIEHKDGGRERIYSPLQFPLHDAQCVIYEPWVSIKIITLNRYVGDIMQMLYQRKAEAGESYSFSGERIMLAARMPLRELMRGFFDELKSISSGYASLSYKVIDSQEADVVRLDILVAEEIVPAFSRIVARHRVYDEAKHSVERLHIILPRQLFSVKIQGKALGRILSAKTLPALKKDVTGHLYGGDVTRKRKLWEKQKKGKKKLRERGKVNIPHEIFLKMMKRDR